jgi:3-oxoacyl-[acyl-carrier-protein] synthase-1
MSKIYIAATNVITSLGFTPEENAVSMANGQTGISCFDKSSFSAVSCFASKVSDDKLEQEVSLLNAKDFTRFEKLLAVSVKKAAEKVAFDIASEDTIFIFSTTKGNIDKLDDRTRINIPQSVKYVTSYFGNKNIPVVISNACISGSAAIVYAERILKGGKYKNAVVTGADILSEFTVSGFQSFKALGAGPCKPFDVSRDGVSLGEGAGTVILTNDQQKSINKIYVAGGAVSNDANHISGPSRTGDGLFLAISSALRQAEDLRAEEISYLSAHGTATPYNDEMECKAFNLAGIQNIPTNSLKGYIGHTLGAAGLIESAMGIYSMENSILFPSAGYSEHGVSLPVNVLKETREQTVKAFIKTGSGFGGCNAALIFAR